jgi:hypothetical protein
MIERAWHLEIEMSQNMSSAHRVALATTCYRATTTTNIAIVAAAIYVNVVVILGGPPFPSSTTFVQSNRQNMCQSKGRSRENISQIVGFVD